MLPYNSASEIFLGCTIFILSILCVSAHSPVLNLGCTCVVRIRQYRSEVTDNKVWIKSMVHLRKIWLAELWGSIRFFISKIFFGFSFRPFLGLWIWNYHRWRQGRKCYGKNIYLGKISLGQQYLNHSQSLRGIKLTDFFLSNEE